MGFIAQESRSQRHAFPPEELAPLMNLSEGETPNQILDALVLWGNLSKRRDLRRASSLAEYARRKDLYSATPRGLAIEAFLDSGLDAATVTAPTGADVLSRIETHLNDLTAHLYLGVPDPDASEALWRQMITDFQAMSGDLRTFALNLDRKLSLGSDNDFRAFKDAAYSYVTRFAAELQGPGRRISQALTTLGPVVQPLLDALARKRTGGLTRTLNVIDQQSAISEISREWQAMSGWFQRPAPEGDGLNLTILNLNHAASQVLSYVDAVHRSRELGGGRAAELRDLALSLDRAESAAQAREELTRHLHLISPMHYVSHPQETRCPDAWTAPGDTLSLTPSVQGRRQGPRTAAALTVSQEALNAAHRAGAAQERYDADLQRLFSTPVPLDGLSLPDPRMLTDLLGWLAQARSNGQSGPVHGPGGQPIRVTFAPGRSCISGPSRDDPSKTWELQVDVRATLVLASWTDPAAALAGTAGDRP